MFVTLVEMVQRVSHRAALPPGAGEDDEESVSPSSGHEEETVPLLSPDTETFDIPKVVYERPKPNSYCTGRL